MLTSSEMSWTLESPSVEGEKLSTYKSKTWRGTPRYCQAAFISISMTLFLPPILFLPKSTTNISLTST